MVKLSVLGYGQQSSRSIYPVRSGEQIKRLGKSVVDVEFSVNTERQKPVSDEVKKAHERE